MKATDLLDAIGGIDSRMVEAAGARPSAVPRKARTRVAVLAACIALLAAGGAVALLLSSGRLSFSQANPRSASHTDVDFIVDEDIRIPVQEIRGPVTEAGPILAELQANQDPASSLLPEYRKTFGSLAQAAEFIGYAPLRIPAPAMEPDSVEVTASADAEGRLTGVQVLAAYSEGDVEAWSSCDLYTEYYDGPAGVSVTSFSDAFEGVDYTGETLERDGREFSLVRSTPFSEGWLDEMVFRQENNVVYQLSLRFRPADRPTADRITGEWMASFREE